MAASFALYLGVVCTVASTIAGCFHVLIVCLCFWVGNMCLHDVFSFAGVFDVFDFFGYTCGGRIECSNYAGIELYLVSATF